MENRNFIEGSMLEKDLIAPAYINSMNPRYVEIDNMYYSGILITNYYREQNDILLN